jgi:formaldehyde-activating enzyme involved in methanogenesis
MLMAQNYRFLPSFAESLPGDSAGTKALIEVVGRNTKSRPSALIVMVKLTLFASPSQSPFQETLLDIQGQRYCPF